MREILFRGKRTYDGEWIEGSLCTTIPSDEDFYTISYFDFEGYYIEEKVIPETVGQYTGLIDKNGTKIFEGDIVKFGISQRIMYVHWNEETLTWELTDIGISTYEVNHLLNTVDLAEIQVESAYGEAFSEVIGNIHNNPELLEGKRMRRKYNRKCGRCGDVHEQSQMHRVKPEYSNNGWLCNECYEDIDMVENDYYCFNEF